MIEIADNDVVLNFPTRAESKALLADAMPLGGLPPACVFENGDTSPRPSPPKDRGQGSTSPQPSPPAEREWSGEGDENLVTPPNGSVDGAVKSTEPASQFSGESGAASPLFSSEGTPHPGPLPSAEREISFPPGTRKQDIEEAHDRAHLCREYIELTKRFSGNQAAKQLGKAASWFSAMVPLYRSGGVAALLPRRRDCGTEASDDARLVSDGDIARINSILMDSNRGKNLGSRNWAIKKYAFKAADCPPALKEMVTRRYQSRKLLLPPSVMNRIRVPEAVISQRRNPTNTSLDYLSAPGSTMWLTNEEGQRCFIRPGQVIEADDATINFAVVIPWEMGGCPCSEKYGVKVARFQWLVAMDVGSRFVPAWTYVCRPKSSYRKEDPITLMNAVYRQYGEPEFWRFERNIWESLAVKRRVRMGGSQLWTVYSPHQKPFIEGLFNKCWTIMSTEDGQVGRYRGEMEKESDLFTAAQEGRFDPRGTFPLLSRAVAAFQEALEEHHSGIIRSKEYGEWVPIERWARRQMQKAELDLDWLAAPMVKRWTVRGNLVGGQVRLFDGYSAPFSFSAEWLVKFHGAKVDCHFDPTVAKCQAMATLAEDYAGMAAGELLGTVHLVNECASYARLVLEWGDDDRGLGRKIRAKAQSAMRREVRTIGADGKFAASTSEVRDGLGNSAKVQTGKTYVLNPDKMFEPLPEPVIRKREARPPRTAEQLAEGEEAARRVVQENALDFL